MKKKLLSLALVLGMMVSMLSVTAFAVNSDMDDASEDMRLDEAHVYSILPGTEEWEKLTPAERYETCSVSVDEVASMTTDALVETVLIYPYLINIYAYDSIELGIDEVSRYFPGLQELFSRSDASSSLENYMTTRMMAMSEEGEIDLSAYDAYTLMGYIAKVEPAATIVLETTTVKTPKKHDVTVIVDMNWTEVSAYLDISPAINYDIALAQSQQYERVYPSATLYRNPAPNYNCHSYAWYSTSSTNKYWMPDPSEYIDDGSYVSHIAEVGCKVTYYRRSDGIYTHSGRIVATPGGPVTVRSKWGALGVFTHDVDDCPYVGNGEGITVSSWDLA